MPQRWWTCSAGIVGPANLLDGAEAGWLQVVLPTTTIAEAETVLCGYGVRRVRRCAWSTVRRAGCPGRPNGTARRSGWLTGWSYGP